MNIDTAALAGIRQLAETEGAEVLTTEQLKERLELIAKNFPTRLFAVLRRRKDGTIRFELREGWFLAAESELLLAASTETVAAIPVETVQLIQKEFFDSLPE